MLDDIADFIADFWYIPLIVIVAGASIALGFGLIDFDHDSSSDSNVCKVTIVADEGIETYYGGGEYDKGKSVELDNIVCVGWFFDGWYDSDGKLLSGDQEYKFTVDKSCTIYAKTTRGYGVSLYKMPGIKTITGHHSYHLDEDATITAKAYPGSTFTGWYDLNKNLVSTEPTLTLTDHKDVALFAYTSSPNPYLGDNARTIVHNENFSETDSYTILRDFRTREVVDYSNGNHGWDLSVAPGQYELLVKGTKTDGHYGVIYKSYIVDGVSTNVYRWDYKEESYSLTWELDTSVYRDYINTNVKRWPPNDDARAKFVNYNSGSVQTIAGKLSDLSSEMSSLDRANFVLKFVQLCTGYELDHYYVNSDQAEYYKYPAETLFEGKGDCEDTAILYCALMKAMGYDVALLKYIGGEYKDNGHVAAAVAFDSVPNGTYYNKNGLKFYYCETTSDTMVVGEIWTDYNKGTVIVIP